MENRMEWMEQFLEEKCESSGDSKSINSSYFSTESDDEAVDDTNSEEENEDEEEGTFYIFKEDNPYKIVETDEDNGVYQVIGNEIIMIARAEGVCCLCSEVTKILYVDNSYGGNIPAQICGNCVQKVLTTEKQRESTESHSTE